MRNVRLGDLSKVTYLVSGTARTETQKSNAVFFTPHRRLLPFRQSVLKKMGISLNIWAHFPPSFGEQGSLRHAPTSEFMDNDPPALPAS